MTVASAPLTRRPRGFTLIEIVITVAIVAILAAIAIPGYQSQRRKTNREVARVVLTELVAKQEATFLKTRRYAMDFVPLYAMAGNTVYLDARGNVKATLQPQSIYKLSLDTTSFDPANPGDPGKFTFTATAIGSQVKDTDCATMSIAHTGAKLPRNDVCWPA